MSEDNVVILNNGDDDDSTIFQSNEDREKLLREILDEDKEDTHIDTTLNMLPLADKTPYWQQLFG